MKPVQCTGFFAGSHDLKRGQDSCEKKATD